MGFLELLANIFTVLCWPSFTLIYPLLVSVRVVETNSSFKTQQCLTYWVLFALFRMLELTLGKILNWFPLWPYAKSVATILLVTPYFGGASYVFNLLIRPYFIDKIWDTTFFTKKKGVVLHGPNDTSTLIDDPESKKLVTGLGNFDLSYDDREVICNQKRVQKEWSCVLCLISASSENCLKEHLRGKKHKTKEHELRVGQLSLRDTCMSSSVPKMSFICNLNIERWSGLLNPVTRSSIRWCKWKKPEIGCIKLNTDGSVDAENWSFGGLFRDYKGEPLCAFVSKAPQDDTFLVELWAVWRGLVLASGLGIKVIWVESDSKSVVKTINREQPYGPKSSSCLRQIWKLLSKFEKYRVTHSWRETNKAADHLSRMVLRKNDVVLWPADFPDILRNIIRDDAQVAQPGSGQAYWKWKYHVHLLNRMTRNAQPLIVHVKSKDDYLKERPVQKNGEFQFHFKLNFVQNTLFYFKHGNKVFKHGNKVKTFNIFRDGSSGDESTHC